MSMRDHNDIVSHSSYPDPDYPDDVDMLIGFLVESDSTSQIDANSLIVSAIRVFVTTVMKFAIEEDISTRDAMIGIKQWIDNLWNDMYPGEV